MRLPLPAAALSLCLSAASLRAAEPGTAGANFLKIGVGPRAAGMGDAQTAVADDAYSAYWNPAGLSQLRYPEAAVMQNQMGVGVSHQHLAYAHPLGPLHAVGGSLTRLSAGTIESYDANNTRRGSVDASDLAFALSYSRLLGGMGRTAPDIRLGVTGRFINEKLASASASTFGGDVGLLLGGFDNAFGEGARGYRLGLAVRNLGPGLKFATDTAPMPRTIATGLAWTGRPWGDPVTLALDYKHAIDDKATASFGAEYWVRRVLAIRAGVVTNQSVGSGFRVGFGVRLKRVLVEYSLAGLGALGDMHRMGLSYRFGGAPDVAERRPEDFINQGQKYLDQKRYYEAVTEFNQALEIDPGNRKAMTLMRTAIKGLEKSAPEPEKSDEAR